MHDVLWIYRCARISSSCCTRCTGSCATCWLTWMSGGRWPSWRLYSGTSEPTSPTPSEDRRTKRSMVAHRLKIQASRRRRSEGAVAGSWRLLRYSRGVTDLFEVFCGTTETVYTTSPTLHPPYRQLYRPSLHMVSAPDTLKLRKV